MKDIKKLQEIDRNPTRETKQKRRNHFRKIKDTLNRGLGKKIFGGWGTGKNLFCDVCKDRLTFSITESIDNRIYTYCSKVSCKDYINQIKKGVIDGKDKMS